MSDRRLRRSDVIARENREKRVTRISRQRLRGLIEEAVENVINEGFLLETSDEDNIDYLSLYKRCKEAFVPIPIITEVEKRCDKCGIRFDKFHAGPLYTENGLWGYAMGAEVSNIAFSKYGQEKLAEVFRSILLNTGGFRDGVFIPDFDGNYPYATTRRPEGFYFYKDSALSIEDIKRESGLL